jgi:L-fuconolactonase
MLIVDSQVHIWAAESSARPWRKRHAPHREIPLDHQSLLVEMDTAGGNRVVIVPPSREGERNDVALAAAAMFPERPL